MARYSISVLLAVLCIHFMISEAEGTTTPGSNTIIAFIGGLTINSQCKNGAIGYMHTISTFQSACTKLDDNKFSLTVDHCSDTEIDVLLDAVCNYYSTPTTTVTTTTITTTTTTTTTNQAQATNSAVAITCTPNSGTAAMIDEQKQRDYIKCVMENELSNDMCSHMVISQSDDSLSLQAACSKLESSQNLLPLATCTENDYNKLHRAICVYGNAITSTIKATVPVTTARPASTANIATTPSQPPSVSSTVASSCSSIIGKPTQAEEQKQREIIRDVIENHLSNEQCKQFVSAQASDETISLQAGCTTLERFHPIVKNLRCTEDDYIKLHNVLCVYGNTSATTTVDEQKQREYIRCVIENELSNDQCKGFVQAQASDETTPLQTGCATLERFHPIVKNLHCTEDDYIKLHDALCVYGNTTTTTTVTNLPVLSTRAPQVTPAVIGEQQQQEVVKAIIENDLSSDACKTIIEAGLPPGISLEAGCDLLETTEKTIFVAQCTAEDYSKLHKAVCEFGYFCGGKATGFDQQKWQADVTAVVHTKLSAACAPAVELQLDTSLSPEAACDKLLDLKDTMLSTGICEQKDFDDMHTVLCEYKSKVEQTALENAQMVIEKQINTSCKLQINNQTSFDGGLEKACGDLTRPAGLLARRGQCSRNEVKLVMKAICYWGSDCTDSSSTSVMSPQEVRITSVIDNLSALCSLTMATGITELSKPSEKACETLASSKESLLQGNVCTEQDFIMLELVVCSETQEGTDMRTVDERREKALSIMANVSSTCHDYIWPRATQYLEDMEVGCQRLNLSKSALIRGGTCTKEDYALLEKSLCASAARANMDEGERMIRDEIDRVILNDVTGSCRQTMGPKIEANADKKLEEDCAELEDNKAVLIGSDICTTDDYSKLHVAICESLSGSTDTLNYSITAVMVCCLLSVLQKFI